MSQYTTPTTSPTPLHNALFAIRSLGMVVVRSGRNATLNSDYATYADIWHMLQKPLAEHKLAVGFSPGVVRKEGDGPNATFTQVMTINITHESGDSIAQPFEILLPDSNRATNRTMCQGMAQTYGKRYALVNMFNLIVGNDEDAELLGQPLVGEATAQPDADAHWRQFCHCPTFGLDEPEQHGAWSVLSNPDNLDQTLGDLNDGARARLWMKYSDLAGLNAWRAELADTRATAAGYKSWDDVRVAFKQLNLPEFFTDCTGEHLANLALALNPKPQTKKA